MIVTKGLTKVYGEVRAVENLDLEVHPEEMFGFLGPNGAGKTTTIRILTTLTKPTLGHAWINGFNVVKNPRQVRREFGIVQQHLSMDWELTVWEILELHARLHHLMPDDRRRRISELLDYIGLAKQANQLVRELSEGMKRRVMIARALIHYPKVLFLDEPTAGVDAQSRRHVWDMIRGMNSDGTTVFLTTHYIEEAEALCQRVGIIHQGQMIALGSPLELRLHLGLVTVETLSNNKNTHYHYFPDRTAATGYIQSLPTDVKTIVVRESNLEDVFIELTGRKVGDE